MKNKGFTLTELITVITILGLIAIVAIPNVINVIKNSKDTIYKKQINTILEGAMMWASDNAKYLPDEGEIIKLTLDQLKMDSYVDLDIKNPSINEPNYFDNNMEISITKKNGVIEYDVLETTIKYVDKINTADYTKIILNGDVLTYVNIGEEYEEKYAYIYGTDKRPNLTDIDINTSTKGTYYLYYDYINSDNVKSTIIRTVIVK